MARRNLSRREIILVGTLAAIALGWLWLRSDGGFSGGQAARELENLNELGDAPVVRMDLLAARDETFDPSGRDLFKYGQKPLTPEELAAMEARRLAQEEARRKAAERAEAARQAAASRPPPQPTRNVPKGPVLPRIDLQYLGNFGPKDDRIAVFEDGQEILIARVGEVVKEQFRVVDIQYGSVVMGYTRPDLADKTQTLKMPGR